MTTKGTRQKQASSSLRPRIKWPQPGVLCLITSIYVLPSAHFTRILTEDHKLDKLGTGKVLGPCDTPAVPYTLIQHQQPSDIFVSPITLRALCNDAEHMRAFWPLFEQAACFSFFTG